MVVLLIATFSMLVIMLLWYAGFLLANDLTLPLQDPREYHRVLALFPHADDETITCGGFLHQVSKQGCSVTLVILTKGERGNPAAIIDHGLKDIRTREAQRAAGLLRITQLIQEDFGDGALHEKKQEIRVYLEHVIEQEKPELLITYDRAGFYGHADHIACSEVITQLQRDRFPGVPLWYVTFPKRVLDRARLPTSLAPTPDAQGTQAIPTQKIFIGNDIVPKIRAWYAYKSQRASLMRGAGRLIPVWFFLSMMVFEYITDAT